MSGTARDKRVKPQNVPSLRLAKAQRLRTPGDYQAVYQSKQWGVSQHHTFNIKASPATSRLGVTVSKKVSKSAVSRNRIKRQIKEFYRNRQFELPNVELIITAKPSCGLATDADRSISLELLWEKILKWQRWRERTDETDACVPEK